MNTESMERGAKAAFNILMLVGALMTVAGLILLNISLNDLSKVSPDGAGGPPLPTSDVLFQCSPFILLIALGLLAIMLPTALRPITMLAFRNARDASHRIDQILTTMEQQNKLLDTVREAAALSDTSKQIAFRKKDRDALRLAIKEDIERADMDDALLLVNEMEQRFGPTRETQDLRDQIDTTQRDVVDRQVSEATTHIDELLGHFDWPAAQKEVDRLLRQLPSHPDVRQLPDRVQRAKDGHKRELLKQWKDAVARDDVDRSVELLRQLDQYLTPSEAEAYKESARGVFKKKLQQLGVQFALHTHDKNHIEALRIAHQIIEEFPNSRMAAELTERMDILTERAHQPVGV